MIDILFYLISKIIKLYLKGYRFERIINNAKFSTGKSEDIIILNDIGTCCNKNNSKHYLIFVGYYKIRITIDLKFKNKN